MTNAGMATVKSAEDTKAIIELGSGETKTANIPRGVSVSGGDSVLVTQVSGKYLIINIY